MSKPESELTIFSLSRTDLDGLNSFNPMPRSQAHRCRYEHAQSAAFYGVYFREFKHHSTSIALRCDSVAQLESRFALHNSAFALNDRELTNVVDIYLQHDFLPVLGDLRT
jgi:hypothetical protein